MAFIIIVLITPFAFLFSCIYIFSEMVQERENRMKESLKIMGLNKYMYPLSIMIQRGLWTLFTAILLSMMTYVFNTDHLSFGQFIALSIATWFLALGNMGICAVLQNFFSDNKLAAIVGAFLVFVPVSIALISIVLPLS